MPATLGTGPDPRRVAARRDVGCTSCPIQTKAVCAHSDPDELRVLDAIKSYRDYAIGQDILAAGMASEMVGSIVRGVVKLTKTAADGRAQIVGLLFAGDLVGRPMRPLALYDATAATDVTLCVFRRARFEELLRASPHLERRFLEMTLDELDAARDWQFLLGRKTAREKVASFLEMLARRGPQAGAVSLALPLTRAEIAAYLGLTIETVSRQLTRLAKDGVITLDGLRGVGIPSVTALRAAAGD